MHMMVQLLISCIIILVPVDLATSDILSCEHPVHFPLVNKVHPHPASLHPPQQPSLLVTSWKCHSSVMPTLLIAFSFGWCVVYTVEPLNDTHIEGDHFVQYREVVLSLVAFTRSELYQKCH